MSFLPMPCQMTKGVICCPSISTHKAATTTSLARVFIFNNTVQYYEFTKYSNPAAVSFLYFDWYLTRTRLPTVASHQYFLLGFVGLLYFCWGLINTYLLALMPFLCCIFISFFNTCCATFHYFFVGILLIILVKQLLKPYGNHLVQKIILLLHYI